MPQKYKVFKIAEDKSDFRAAGFSIRSGTYVSWREDNFPIQEYQRKGTDYLFE